MSEDFPRKLQVPVQKLPPGMDDAKIRNSIKLFFDRDYSTRVGPRMFPSHGPPLFPFSLMDPRVFTSNFDKPAPPTPAQAAALNPSGATAGAENLLCLPYDRIRGVLHWFGDVRSISDAQIKQNVRKLNRETCKERDVGTHSTAGVTSREWKKIKAMKENENGNTQDVPVNHKSRDKSEQNKCGKETETKT